MIENRGHRNGRGRWIKLPKEDMAILGEELCRKGPSAKAVWIALLTIRYDRNTPRFTVKITLIASIADLSYKTVQKTLPLLQGLGFIRIKSGPPQGVRAECPNTYTILRDPYSEADKTSADFPSTPRSNVPRGNKKEETTHKKRIEKSYPSW